MVLDLMKQGGERAQSDMQKPMKSKTPTRKDPGNPLWNTFKCGDGKWMALAILTTDPHWPVVLEALCHPVELVENPAYQDHWGRCSQAGEMTEILDPIFASNTREFWLERFTAKGVCYQYQGGGSGGSTGFTERLYHRIKPSSHGAIKLPGFPVTLSETPAKIHRHAPEFSEHTEAVLIDLMGLDWEQVTDLRERKTILTSRKARD